MEHMVTRRSSAGSEAVRITTAAQGRDADIASRQRRYLLSMAIRVVCFVAAVAVGPGWLRWVLVAGAVLLPYVAVVLANATDTREDAFSLDDASATRGLPSGPDARAVPPPRQGDDR
jgi:Flp pilus assembly protein TadB